MHVDNPIIVPGYDHDQIDSHLRLLLERGLVYNGVNGGPMIGIFFSGLTSAGNAWLQHS